LRVTPKIQLVVEGNAVSSPSRAWLKGQLESNLTHFSIILYHLVATILIIFLRINWPNPVQLGLKPLKLWGP